MSAAQPAAHPRDWTIPAVVILGASAFTSLTVWWFLTGSLTAAFGGLAVIGLAGAAVVWAGIAALRADDSYGLSDPDEHLEPLRTPGPAEATLTTDLRQRRMLLRPRGLDERRAAQLATKVKRRTMRLRDLAHMAGKPVPSLDDPAPKPVLADSGAEVAAPPAPSVPAPARKGGRHAAPKGSKPQPVPVLVAESRFPGAAPAVAHEDRTEVLPALPALILGGETA